MWAKTVVERIGVRTKVEMGPVLPLLKVRNPHSFSESGVFSPTVHWQKYRSEKKKLSLHSCFTGVGRKGSGPDRWHHLSHVLFRWSRLSFRFRPVLFGHPLFTADMKRFASAKNFFKFFSYLKTIQTPLELAYRNVFGK